MQVVKRDGTLQDVSFDKILQRVKKLGNEANIHIDYASLVIKVIDQLHDRIPTFKIDELTAEQCAVMSSQHYDYATLAGRVVVSNLHKSVQPSFCAAMERLYQFRNHRDEHQPLVSQYLWDLIQEHGAALDAMIHHERDYLIDYFGFRTLERSYLFRVRKQIVERPQHMWMRVALGIHGNPLHRSEDTLRKIQETYDLMSTKHFTHATPTLFNAGTPRPQLSSCFLLAMEEDSLRGIYNTLHDCAMISKFAGGVGLNIHNVRAKGTYIQGTSGFSNGIVPMLRVFNNTARYVDQCVPHDTLVHTDQGMIPISQCIAGVTRVLNAKGTWETVQDVLEHRYRGLAVQVVVAPLLAKAHALKQIFTPEHPVQVVRNTVGTDVETFRMCVEKGTFAPEYVEAKELDKNDWLVMPRIHWSSQQGFARECALRWTVRQARLAGMMAAAGTWSLQRNGGRCLLRLPGTEEALETLREAKATLEECMIPAQLTISSETTNVQVELCWIGEAVQSPFRYAHFFDARGRSRVHPEVWRLPADVLRAFVSAYQATMTSRTLSPSWVVQLLCVAPDMIPTGFGNLANRFFYTDTHVYLKITKVQQDNLWSGEGAGEEVEPEGAGEEVESEEAGEEDGGVEGAEDGGGGGVMYDLQMRDEHSYCTAFCTVHNGGGKRNGSFAIYLEPWHPDVEDFLDMRKNTGEEELRARDLFYALWIPDLFMKRVSDNGSWSLFCPHECPGLYDSHGAEFEQRYQAYEATPGKARKTLPARQLWFRILDAQMETGTPFLLFKDACNLKSNQRNLGTIRSSNLCCEVVEYSDENQTAVCNLASIALAAFVNEETRTVDYEALHRVTQVVTENLNRVIDVNYYPTEKTERSNFRHRPIGIGVQGLADAFLRLKLPFHSEEAKCINRRMFETMYHAALTKSMELAREKGPYESFQGSPAAEGVLQFDLWGVTPEPGRYDWDTLKENIRTHGLRNSLLMATMPTASTSQILGYNECFEPITSNLYSRSTLAGDFLVVNKYLMKELIEQGLWNEQVKNNIIANKGSVQQLSMLSEELRERYKIVWEIPMKHLIDMAADRGAYICQSQSLNLWMEDPTYAKLTSMHVYGWKAGLKTGIYYLRRKAKHQPQQFTIEPEANTAATATAVDDGIQESGGRNKDKDNKDDDNGICLMCSA